MNKNKNKNKKETLHTTTNKNPNNKKKKKQNPTEYHHHYGDDVNNSSRKVRISVPVIKFPFPRDNLRSPARTTFNSMIWINVQCCPLWWTEFLQNTDVCTQAA